MIVIENGVVSEEGRYDVLVSERDVSCLRGVASSSRPEPERGQPFQDADGGSTAG